MGSPPASIIPERQREREQSVEKKQVPTALLVPILQLKGKGSNGGEEFNSITTRDHRR